MAKTWMITGCSSGFGLNLAEAVLARGDRLVATARDTRSVRGLVERYPDTAIAVSLDVTVAEAATAAVGAAVTAFDGLDVLVNNAGYGFIGAVEEATPEEYRPVFEVNVFGLIETTRAALPALRANTGARIVNFSSVAGIVGSAGSGYYNASKFAVEGLSEALALELAPFGVKVVIVEPGPFRTAFLGRSITTAANEMDTYVATAGKRRRYSVQNDGQQAGDPAKAVAVILLAVDADDPPLHLPLGPAAHAAAERKLAGFRADIDAWRDIAIATDFASPEASVDAVERTGE